MLDKQPRRRPGRVMNGWHISLVGLGALAAAMLASAQDPPQVMGRPQSAIVEQSPKPADAPSVDGPSWPQTFELRGPEVATFGFPVSRPGPIVVDVEVQGAPVVAALESPAAQVAQKHGNGALRLAYTARPQDIQKNPFWIISVKLARQGGAAAGRVRVQHPPADSAQVRSAMTAARAQGDAARSQRKAAAAQEEARIRVHIDQELRKQNTALRQQDAQRRTALIAQLQPMVDQMRASDGAIRTRSIDDDTDGANADDSDVQTRAVSRSDWRGPRVFNPPPPNPAITALSVARGQPGDPIMINGSGFGAAGGELHFVVGPGRDLVAPAGIVWTDTQLFAVVPGEQGGLAAFNGTVYVKRADQTVSNLVAFAFNPLIERRQITSVPADRLLEPIGSVQIDVPGDYFGFRVDRYNRDCWSGHWGHDRFFANSRLQNGWRVSQPPVIYHPSPLAQEGSAILMDSRVGTDWPYAYVRWSVNLGPWCTGVMGYAVALYIEGPLGTKDGIVVR